MFFFHVDASGRAEGQAPPGLAQTRPEPRPGGPLRLPGPRAPLVRPGPKGGILRRQLTAAITVDTFLKILNGYLEDVGYGKLEKVTEDELKECLRRIGTVEVIVKDGKEVVWLWGGRRLRELVNRIVDIATQEGEINVC